MMGQDGDGSLAAGAAWDQRYQISGAALDHGGGMQQIPHCARRLGPLKAGVLHARMGRVRHSVSARGVPSHY
jgi:hypothetical protein